MAGKKKIISIILLSIFLLILSSELNRAWATKYQVWFPTKIIRLYWKCKK